MKNFLSIIGLLLVVWGCKEDLQPKPKGFLALEFPAAQYVELDLNCPYAFKVNDRAIIQSVGKKKDCRFNIVYPKMKGTIYMTYEEVAANLDELLVDAQKLPLKHTIKADEIFGDEYLNPDHRSYGMLYTVTGDAASQSQFYLTDSVRHFLTGSVYFDRVPNYDSLYPASEYLKEDMKTIMESTRWKD